MTEGLCNWMVLLTFAGGMGIGLLIGWLEWGRRLKMYQQESYDWD